MDAIPDLSENQVIVFADWSGRSPQEVEDQVTYPLTVNLQGLAGVKTVRSASMFGFSLITIIFHDHFDNYFARTRVLERLSSLDDVLPAGVKARLGPDATGLGWVYQYYLDVDPAKSPDGGYNLGELRAIQDWFIRYQLNAVEGVAEVGSIGGFVRQYQVEVSSFKMRAAEVSLAEVITAVEASNLNVGAKVIEENAMEFVVRGVGLVSPTNGIAELESVVLAERKGTPIYLKDIGSVQIGGDFRRGTLDIDGREVVGGIVVMRTGENGLAVINRVKEKIQTISKGLPPGIQIRSFYDRSELIESTLDTLKHALLEEIILVTLAHIVFLWHFRSVLIVTAPLPISILIAFILMNQAEVSSNIMSLAGIAIAIGVLVDAGIVMTENVIRHCERAELDVGRRLTVAETLDLTRVAGAQVGRPIFYAMLIIILAFVPVFALSGQEGKLFHPLAFTKTFAMIGSTLLAVTLVPVLCSFLVRGPFHAENRNWVMRVLMFVYEPCLKLALQWRKTVLGTATLLLAVAIVIAVGLPREWSQKIDTTKWPTLARLTKGMGTEFMPPLNEGSLLFMPVLIPSTSLTEVKRVMAWQDKVISDTPEVISAAGKLGRAETATDPAPVEMIETTIMLKPEFIVTNRTFFGGIKIPWTIRNPEWRKGMTKEKLVAELTEKLSLVPGYIPGFLQPIENRILMLSTGIRGQVGVKLLGDNLDELQAMALKVEKLAREIPGSTGVAASRLLGKPYVEIEVDRLAMARYGLRAKEVLEVVEAGIGGRNVTTTIEGRKRFPIQVRLARDERDDIEKLKDILVSLPGGARIPLGMLTTIRRTLGPSEIHGENGRLQSYVQMNVQGRDLGGFVEDLQERISAEVEPRLPVGMTIEYSGQFENQLRAQQTLQFIVPAALLIIFMLLFMVYRSAVEAAHVILAVPFALTGGVFFQYWLGYNFSVAVWVGYIALFGTAIQTGVIMVVYLDEMVNKSKAERGSDFNQEDLIAAIIEGAKLRLRPKVMTVTTIVASLLPIMWMQRMGAEVMKPLAAPVIGGMVSSLIHILIVTPVIFAWLRERELKKQSGKSLS